MTKRFDKLFSLEGKISIVTGACGQLGGEYVRALLDAGSKVAAFDMSLENPKGRLKDIRSKNLMLVKADVTKRPSIEKGLKAVLTGFGKPNVLINNAAIDTPPGETSLEAGLFENYPEKSWQKAMDVNLKGVLLCCQVIGGHMARYKTGSIINISSIYGMLSPDQRIYEYKNKPFFKPVSYSVTKAGVLNLTRYLATYWAKRNVRVNTLTLGGVFNNQDEKFITNYTSKVPLGRMANQSDYNGAILFLASDASAYMTGSNLIIDGGYTAW